MSLLRHAMEVVDGVERYTRMSVRGMEISPEIQLLFMTEKQSRNYLKINNGTITLVSEDGQHKWEGMIIRGLWVRYIDGKRKQFKTHLSWIGDMLYQAETYKLARTGWN